MENDFGDVSYRKDVPSIDQDAIRITDLIVSENMTTDTETLRRESQLPIMGHNDGELFK